MEDPTNRREGACRRKEKRNRVPLTDDESDEETQIKSTRHESQRLVRSEIERRLQGSKLDNRWVPDAQDARDLHLYIVQPMIDKCGKKNSLQSTIPAYVLDKIKDPANTEKLANDVSHLVSKTGYDYEYAFKRLMFHFEEQKKRFDPGNLSSDGRLHIRQFFQFKENTFLAPSNILDLLEKNFDSPNLKMKAYLSYKCMLDQMYAVASGDVGKAKFKAPITEEEKSWDVSKQVEKGLKKQQRLLSEIRNVQAEMKISKPFIRWLGQRKDEQKLKEENQRMFEGLTLPDPNEIYYKWLNHQSTLEMEKKICELAKSKVIVSGNMLNRITKYLITKLSMKIGARIEVWKKATWKHFQQGRDMGPAAFPYKHHLSSAIDANNPAVANRIMHEDSEVPLYVRANPWQKDPLDMDDEMKNDSLFQILKGTCLTIKNHKTGSKYPFYIWLSQIDVMMLLCYEEIVHTFSSANGITLTINSPIFINPKGIFFCYILYYVGQYLGKSYIQGNRSLDLDEFSRIVGIPKATNVLFRKLFTRLVFDHGTGKIKF